MHANTIKNNVHLHAQFIGQYWAIYRPIFQISAFFATNDMANDFPISYRQQAKKGDIGRYLGRLRRYLK